VLETHSWPGNIRELENVMRRLAVVTQAPREVRVGEAGGDGATRW
jgi:DNA-binding NtrC family response regulator